MIFQVIAAYFVSIFFAIMFNASKKQLLYCGFVGALGWFVYLWVLVYIPSVALASFYAALSVSFLAFILARIRKVPITVFQIPGIIPLVPGMGMYKTLYAVVSNNPDEAIFQLFRTFQIAGAIAVAMMIVFSLSAIANQYKRHIS